MSGRNRFPTPDWARPLIRETGLLEDVCIHGVGHPNQAWLDEHDPTGEKCFGIHGCDGCCRSKE